MKTNRKELLVQLVQKLQRMGIPDLYKNLVESVKKQSIIKLILPQQFQSLIDYEMSVEKSVSTELWEENMHFLPTNFLNILTPRQLFYVGSKCRSGNSSWERWYDHSFSENESECGNLADYFKYCKTERIEEILKWSIDSTKGVKAPLEKDDHNLFIYQKGVQFPFEVIFLLSTIHPSRFFPAVNTLRIDQLKRLFWLCETMCGQNDTMENIFAHEYFNKHKPNIDEEIGVVIEHMHLLQNKQFYLFSQEMSEENQGRIIASVDQKRFLKMKEEGYFSSYALHADKTSTEDLLGKILKDTKKAQYLHSRRTMELITELLD